MGNARLSIDEVLIALKQTKKSGAGYLAQCPAHEDRTASLSVSSGESGRILLHCFAGCSHDAIIAALGLTPKQLSPDNRQTRPTYISPSGRQEAVYDYCDADGVLRYQVVRKRLPNGDKTFQQRRPHPDQPGEWIYKTSDIPKFPYRLNQLKDHATIYVVEGEKDADRLWAEGLPATTNVGGSGKGWRDTYSEALKAIGVTKAILIPDNDEPGRKHMHTVAQSLKSVGIVITYVPLPDVKVKGDVSDWLLQGNTRADLEQLVASKFSVVPPNAELGASSPTIDEEVNELRRNTSGRHAELFAERYGGAFKFNHLRDKWLRYESPCWQIDADMGIYRAALEFALVQQREAVSMERSKKKEATAAAVKAESPAAIDNMLKLAKANLVFSDRGENWDADPWLLAVTNGVVDLRTGLLRPGAPSDRISLKCAVPYEKDAQCPRWWQFLAEIFGGDEEIVEFVWRLCGYCLTGQTTERIVPMLYGRGANGKSVFLNVLATILGDYSFTLPFSSLQFQKQEGIPNDLAALVGRRFVTMIEANDGLRLNEAKLKTLSGNDRISARFLNCEFFTFQPVAKFVLAMNHKPIAKDDSPGFWDRIRLVPFLHTFPEGSRDEGLQARLIASEGAGILAWAIEGCLRWQTSGLTKPKAVIAATAEYQADSDQLSEFLSTCCSVENPETLTGAGGVQKAYNGWADNRGLSKFERLSSTALGRLLSERFQKRRTMNGLFYVGLEVQSQNLW